MGAWAVRHRVWLARQCEEFEEIEMAMESGTLPFAKALLVARGRRMRT
jgi:hypothetical protein